MSPPCENVNSSPKCDEYLKGPCMALDTPLCRGCNPRDMYNSQGCFPMHGNFE